MGLGLTICKKLVDAMEGYISCHSQVNKGTTMTIELPVTVKASFCDDEPPLETEIDRFLCE